MQIQLVSAEQVVTCNSNSVKHAPSMQLLSAAGVTPVKNRKISANKKLIVVVNKRDRRVYVYTKDPIATSGVCKTKSGSILQLYNASVETETNDVSVIVVERFKRAQQLVADARKQTEAEVAQIKLQMQAAAINGLHEQYAIKDPKLSVILYELFIFTQRIVNLYKKAKEQRNGKIDEDIVTWSFIEDAIYLMQNKYNIHDVIIGIDTFFAYVHSRREGTNILVRIVIANYKCKEDKLIEDNLTKKVLERLDEIRRRPC